MERQKQLGKAAKDTTGLRSFTKAYANIVFDDNLLIL